MNNDELRGKYLVGKHIFDWQKNQERGNEENPLISLCTLFFEFRSNLFFLIWAVNRALQTRGNYLWNRLLFFCRISWFLYRATICFLRSCNYLPPVTAGAYVTHQFVSCSWFNMGPGLWSSLQCLLLELCKLPSHILFKDPFGSASPYKI
jgi:hypothetical protein